MFYVGEGLSRSETVVEHEGIILYSKRVQFNSESINRHRHKLRRYAGSMINFVAMMSLKHAECQSKNVKEFVNLQPIGFNN